VAQGVLGTLGVVNLQLVLGSGNAALNVEGPSLSVDTDPHVSVRIHLHHLANLAKHLSESDNMSTYTFKYLGYQAKHLRDSDTGENIM